jgi:hypothetical protein
MDIVSISFSPWPLPNSPMLDEKELQKTGKAA